MLNQKKLQTNKPKGSFRFRDKHPSAEGLRFAKYRDGKEYWITEEAFQRDLGNRDKREKRLNKGVEKVNQIKAQSGLPLGSFSRGDNHPTLDLVFNSYQTYSWSNEKAERWQTRSQRSTHQSKATERQSIRNRGRQNESEETQAIYKQAARLNNILQGNVFHVDHTIPLSRGGKHEPNNLQIVPASWNLSKNNNNSKRWEIPYGQ
jgi:5-methylcytosine-specific restriction endonuclease McrA